MNDLKEKILEKLREHTLASFATITEDGKPWTRYVVVKADDQMNIWFATFKNSRKISHIVQDPQVQGRTLDAQNQWADGERFLYGRQVGPGI